jgi:hypothetical protein
MTDTVVVLVWLVFAHLVADFVLQNDWIAINKGQGGQVGWQALGVHGFHVGLCLLPAVPAFGLAGLVYLVIVVGTHMMIDRWKVVATRRAEHDALDAARRREASLGVATPSGLGSAWTPWPGMLFLADQVLHITIAVVGWLVILSGVALQPAFVDAVNLVVRTWDRAAVHAVVLTMVVATSLFLINTRAAYYFVLALVSPRELPEAPPAPAPAPTDGGPDASAAAPIAQARPRAAVPTGAAARISATIGALERLLVVVFVLHGVEVAVVLLVAAKAFTRFRQLESRGYADYFLLGTLASVSVAFASALLARAVLSTIP